MKKLIKREINPEDNVIHVTMYLKPLIYLNSEVLGAVEFDKKTHRYNTDVEPTRCINGPLSGPGECLENPIQMEWDHFIDDCRFLIKEVGFTIISENTSESSKKSEYFVVFGMKDNPCGTLVYDLRVSDHPFDATFPEEAKDAVLEYLKMNKILDNSAAKEGIDFAVENVLVGHVKNDSWNKAFNRLYDKLKKMRNSVQNRLKDRSSNT